MASGFLGKAMRSTRAATKPFIWSKKLNEMAEIRQVQRLTKPPHYHCANPASY
ncbi:MAG TPA: hypothetical protein VKI44_22625 [Acetobacteraceae bacterium]|nr:hypothetical protein [Acetobacteraceae bacterium]